MIIILMDDIKWIFEDLPLGVEWRHFTLAVIFSLLNLDTLKLLFKIYYFGL